jgi:hypothetical protein
MSLRQRWRAVCIFLYDQEKRNCFLLVLESSQLVHKFFIDLTQTKYTLSNFWVLCDQQVKMQNVDFNFDDDCILEQLVACVLLQ